jgi:deoxyribodipyrimidine photolyase-related protein
VGFARIPIGSSRERGAVPGRFKPELPVPSALAAELDARRPAASRSGRSAATTRVLVLPDQLSLEIGPVAAAEPCSTEVWLVESGEWLSRRPYHRQRLAWILLSQRAFAIEAAEKGFEVRVLRGDLPMVDLLTRAIERCGSHEPLLAMEPAERETRAELAPLIEAGLLQLAPHAGFMTNDADLEHARTAEGWRMDRFYQAVRRRTGILMERGKPVGGKFSFDAENRKRWDGTPAAPTPPTFPASLLREEVVSEIETRFASHPGTLDVSTIPMSRAEIDRMWQWAKRQCLTNFGPYEDAMSRRSRGIFHTRLSPLMNLHRLLPSRVIEEVASLDLPLQSKEGFIRQILGWREFVYRVHRATDGFRSVPEVLGSESARPLARPGDGGYSRWAGAPWKPRHEPPPGVDGGARPNRLGANLPVPAAWWGAPSGLACLDHVVGDVWEEGWSHHITRLMVLSNIATLLAVSPRELCDWFWAAYIDSWDWVVEPNVLGMSTYGYAGMTTKPYVSGSAYIEKMGDSCSSCAFTPGKDCPIGELYWAFLARNERALCDNPRMKLVLASMRGREGSRREADSARFVRVRDVLIHGQPLASRDQGLFQTRGGGSR